MRDAAAMAADLLGWYDRHARDLPWRVGPAQGRAGQRPDPYAVWLSEVMLQQTTVAAVKGYFTRFLDLWPDVGALAAADDGQVMGEWAGLGYYARARNLLKCARRVAGDHGGVFPDSAEALSALPGIGPYTAAAVAAIAFDRPETVVDGNVERVMARLFRVEMPLPSAKPELRARAAEMTPRIRPGDYAQAVMDLGATICTPKSPACGICPWQADCGGRMGHGCLSGGAMAGFWAACSAGPAADGTIRASRARPSRPTGAIPGRRCAIPSRISTCGSRCGWPSFPPIVCPSAGRSSRRCGPPICRR